MKLPTLLLVLLCAPATLVFASDTNGDGYETVLVPFGGLSIADVGGAQGTLWHGELWAENVMAVEACLQAKYHYLFACEDPIRANFVGTIFPLAGTPAEPASLFILPAEDAKHLHFSSRLYEVSRRAQPEGVAMPVVREGAFFTTTASFLGIHGGTDVRSTLRVYDVYRVGITLRAELLAENGSVLGSHTIVIAPSVDPGMRTNLLSPASTSVDVAQVFPAIRDVSRYHLRLSSLSQGVEYWACVSVTDNDTQHFLVITSD